MRTTPGRVQTRIPSFAIRLAILFFGVVVATRAAEISVVEPANNQTIHSNQGELSVFLRRQSEAPGSKVRIVLDGTILPHSYRGDTIKLHGIERGSHTLQAVLLDDRGERIAVSARVSFYMWHASRLLPGRK